MGLRPYCVSHEAFYLASNSLNHVLIYILYFWQIYSMKLSMIYLKLIIYMFFILIFIEFCQYIVTCCVLDLLSHDCPPYCIQALIAHVLVLVQCL